MAKKKKTNKKLVSLHVTTEQKEWLTEMGGVTEGIRKLFGFWYSNYDLWELEEKKRLSIKKRLEAIK